MKIPQYLLIIGLCLTAGLSFAEQSKEPQAVLEEANDLFRQANTAADENEAEDLYEQSAMLYRQLINQYGIENSKLYYNLANACLLKDDLGRAILNYRKALELDSSNRDIRKNLAFARAKRKDKIAPETGKTVLRTLFFWHYNSPISVRLMLGLLLLTAASVCVSVIIHKGPRAGLITIAVLLILPASALLISTAVEHHYRINNPPGVIIAEQTTARQGDGKNYPPAFTEPLHSGTEFVILEQRPGWWYIKLPDGSTGWIVDDAAEKI